MSDNIKYNDDFGLLTYIWGDDMWNSLHYVSFGYPNNPTNDKKQQYKTYFESLKYVLPCCVCRKHLTEHTKEGSQFEITIEIFENRDTLTRWLYDLHSRVNEMLEINYDITYEDLCKKYNSYVAECSMTIEKKMIAYKNDYNREAPFVDYRMATYFRKYAKKRGFKNYLEKLNETYFMYNNKRSENNELWIKRNEKCWKIIKKMRLNGKLGFETDGEFKNLPSVYELKLLQLMCTTMKQSSLEHMIKKLGIEIIKQSNKNEN